RRPEGDDVGRRRAGERGARNGIAGGADHGDLAMRREQLLERHEHPPERARSDLERVADETNRRRGTELELVVAPEAREAKQDVREHRIAAGGRMTVQLLLPGHELLAVDRRLEEAAVLVAEVLDREQPEPVRLAEPSRLAGRDVELEQAVGDIRIVLEVAGALGHSVPPRPVQAPTTGRQRAEQELAERGRGVET